MKTRTREAVSLGVKRGMLSLLISVLWVFTGGISTVRAAYCYPGFTLPTGANGLCDEDPCCTDEEELENDDAGRTSSFWRGDEPYTNPKAAMEELLKQLAQAHELQAKAAQANKEQQRQLMEALMGGKATIGSGGVSINVGDRCRGCGGMPIWSVSEPSLSVFIKDQPISYRPPRGPRVAFTLAHKARTYGKDSVIDTDPLVYSVGYKWRCSWRWYVESDGTNTWVFSGGGSARRYTLNVKEYNTKSWLELVPAQGQNPEYYVLHHADGARYVFAQPTTDTNNPDLARYFITRQEDAAGDALVFTYDTDGHVRLTTVTDAAGNDVSISYYANHPSGIDSLVYRVTDAWDRYAELEYDDYGNLAAITDAGGIRSTMEYGAGNTVSALTTPYGTTRFEYFTSSSAYIGLRISEPAGAMQFWAAIDTVADSNKIPSSYGQVPNTGALGLSNTFDNSGLNNRNTLHWDRRQYGALSQTVRENLDSGVFNVDNMTVNDFKIARLRHWLISEMVIENGDMVSYVGGETLSLQRDPHPETTANNPLEGLVTWFDYDGKPFGQSDYEGTTKKPRFIARILPNGQTEFLYFERTNSFAHPTKEISTYTLANGTVGTRTSTYIYSTNETDLLVVTNASGVRAMSNWYSGHLLLTNYNALNEMTVLAYNGNHQLISVKRPNGLITTNLYDANGWLASRIEYVHPAGGNATYYGTNAFTWEKALVRTHTDPRNLTTTFHWDGLRRLVGTSYPDGTTTSNRFVKLDGTGYYEGTGDTDLLDLTASKDRMNRWMYLTYNGLRQLTAATNTLGTNVVKYEVCPCGSIEKITDAAGQEIEFYYDLLGRMTNAVYYGGAYSVTNRYNLVGQLTNVIDPLGSLTNWYNNQGLLVAVSNYVGRVKTVVYDIEDRPASVTDANGITVSHTYDTVGRLRTRTWPDNNTENWGYSAGYAGPTSYTNQLGGLYRTLIEYDPLQRKITDTNANNEVVRFAYRPGGDLASLTDGKNQVTTWNYDLYGRVTNKVDAASAEIFRYTYDATGLLTARWSKAKGTTTYSYDALGRMTGVNYPNSTDLTLAYDVLDRLTNLVDSVGTTRCSYANNRLASEDGPWAEDTVSYSYQYAGPRSGLTLLQPNASPWTQSYGYDAAERLTSVASPAGSFGYAYDSTRVALPGTLTLPNGATVATSYDFMARLTNTTLRTSQQAVLNHHGYGYNAASQRTSVTNLAGNTVAYTYDRSGQLVQASGKEAGGTTRMNEQFGYGYDAAGNLAKRTNDFAAAEPLVQTFSIGNSLNQLTTVTRTGKLTVAGTTTTNATSVTVNGVAASRYGDATFAKDGFTLADGANTFTAIGQDALGRLDTNTVAVNLPATVSFTYDDNGNLLSDGRRVFSYDDENQLISVILTNGVSNSTLSKFAYDGFGRRRVRTECVWQNGGWATNGLVRYVYDGMVVLQERDGNNLPMVTYTRGPDLSGSLQGAGGIGGLLSRTDQTTPTWSHAYYHADGNGNVTCLINEKQAVVARYVYEPYGNLVSFSGPLAEVNLYRFSSKEAHPVSGLVYYGFRFYDPNLQRWVNRDPIEEHGGVHLCAFSDNSPLSGYDPFGLRVTKPPKKLGFCLDDVEAAVRLADAAGIKGVGDKSMSQMWQEMKDDKRSLLTWVVCRPDKGENNSPTTNHLPELERFPTIHFPKCDPASGKNDIIGTDEVGYYFQAALIHELVHAYGLMMLKNPLEQDARRVGREMNDYLEKLLNQRAR